MSMQLCEQNAQKKAPRDGFARGCTFGANIGRPCVIGVPECFARGCVFGLCAGACTDGPYAYSTLMVFVLPLRPLMMPPVIMTLSPFSSCMTARLTFSAW